MRRVAVSDDISLADYNSSNHHERDPYIISDGSLVVDHEWWENALTPFIREAITQRVGHFTLGKVVIPHALQRDPDLTRVYQAFQDGHEYQHWFPVIAHADYAPQNVHLIRVHDEAKIALLERVKSTRLARLRADLHRVFDEATQSRFFVRT
jgi:hypothetical protein